MKALEAIFKQSSPHHAQILIGEPEMVIPAVIESLAKHWKLSVNGNPDLYQYYFTTLGVDDVQAIRESERQKAFRGGRKVFVIGLGNATIEALQALLKTLEEPAPETYFFLLAKRADIFLPTILSRCELHLLPKNDLPQEILDSFRLFSQANRATRLKMIDTWLTQESDLIHRQLTELLNGLEFLIRDEGNINTLKTQQKNLTMINELRHLTTKRGYLPKLIFEDLALNLPTKN